MKGSREGKVDGSKVAGPALFPRLHVSDTKKAGPRGPPRNKMALYEQLTVPSHKYKPSLVPLPSPARVMNYPAMTTPIYQPQVHASSFDSRYSYMPMSYMSTMVPTMGYVPMMNVGVYGVGAGATVTSSMNGSSARSTVVDGSAAESQRVPWGGETLSRQNSDSGQSRRTTPSKKRKENDDFAVPTYSSATQASSQSRPLANPFQDRQGFIGGRAAEKGKELAMGKRYSACVNQSRHLRKEMSMDDDSCTSASMECETVSAVDDDVNTLEIGYRKMSVFTRDSDSSQMELNTPENGQERVKDQKIVAERSGEGLNKQSTLTTPIAVPPELLHERDSLRAVPEQDIFSSQSSENRSVEVSEPSQRRRGSSAETDSSTGSICFRDVVDAFGQAEFWKTHSTIIRQQKIFSKQVFELHRVIEVQQLLAKTSSLSLNFEEVLEEVEAEKVEEQEADNVAMPASPVADVPEVPEVCPDSANLNPSSDDNSRPVPEALPSQPVYPLPVPYQQNVNWPASPYAANPWGARMPSQPLMYAPYPGPCSPAYGAYPYMGASMAMYGNSGGMPAARFPTWQQPVIPQPWGSVESVAAAAAAWSGEQVVPPLPRAGIVPQTSLIPERQNSVNSERHTSAADQSTQDARQSGEPAKDIGWGKVWGSIDKHVAGPLAPSDSRDDDRGNGVGHSSDSNRDQAGEVAASSESESIWGAGGVPGSSGWQQNRAALKRARPETVPWFQTMSPAKRLMQQAPNGVIKVLPRAVAASPESAASILLSLQKERQR